jgi:hypothetical protein
MLETLTEAVTKHLRKARKKFTDYTEFSDKPGIYAFFFDGLAFPLKGYSPVEGEIIYIGKTESSEESRSLRTHFSSGKTGSSTVRRTIGALLRDKLNLIPIPRSNGSLAHSNFKFDEHSEDRLTKWMKDNLALGFYPYPRTAGEIESFEKSLIATVAPILNLRDNPHNPYLKIIKSERKIAAQFAARIVSNLGQEKSPTTSLKITAESMTSKNKGLYTPVWETYYPSILASLKKGKAPVSIQLDAELFKTVGNRKSYTFRLHILNGRVYNNISGSAVARDLAEVIMRTYTEDQKPFMNFTIRMDNNFKLVINF